MLGSQDCVQTDLTEADFSGIRQLYDFRARTYDPAQGRFMQRDPKGYVDGMNLYDAFGSNPMTNVDPRGTSFINRVCKYCALGEYGENDKRVAAISRGEQLGNITTSHERRLSNATEALLGHGIDGDTFLDEIKEASRIQTYDRYVALREHAARSLIAYNEAQAALGHVNGP